MHIRNSAKYNKDINIIHPGEYYVSDEDEIIGTLLGSCIAVCLFDKEEGISGMNHFMLPGKISNNDIFKDKSARYGITAINQLLDLMIDKGAGKKNIVAKIFGGGHVLETTGHTVTIPNDNIKLAKIMMEIEDIPIIQINVGENFTRKLLMDVKSGKVYLRKSNRKEVLSNINKRDYDFSKRSLVDE